MLYANGYPVGGGGGGTGGHTIIDENGNSMSARAGLQFVGADVSDDGTNNKTIVDLASAGGIDGVFPDLSNDLGATFTFDSTQHTWEATEDCVIGWNLIAIDSGTGAYIDIIDGADSLRVFNSYEYQHGAGGWALVKKGQTVSYRAKASTSGGGFVSSIKAFGIQTGTTHSKFQPVIYSLEEREIGVWTDGKPLYQKTYVIGQGGLVIGTQWTDTGIELTDGELIINTEVIRINARGTELAQSNIDNTTNHICFRSSAQLTLPEGSFFTIQYTKTTDTAGSGTWTPQGVPAVHYSTDEQVIGTWIDGKTLYEKTIDFGALPNNNAKSVNHNISNFDKIISINGIAIRTDGNTIPIPHAHYSTMSNQLQVSADSTTVVVRTGSDASNRNGYITIQYTKTS